MLLKIPALSLCVCIGIAAQSVPTPLPGEPLRLPNGGLGFTPLNSASNLSDVRDAAAARAALGFGNPLVFAQIAPAASSYGTTMFWNSNINQWQTSPKLAIAPLTSTTAGVLLPASTIGGAMIYENGSSTALAQGGTPVLLILDTKDSSTYYQLSYVNEAVGTIANYMSAGNNLRFDMFNASSTRTGINALIGFGGIAAYGASGTNYVGLYQSADDTLALGAIVDLTSAGANTPALTIATAASNLATFAGKAKAAGLYSTADGGGIASTTGMTNVNNTTTTNAYVVKGGQAATTANTGWIKLYFGTTAIWVPYWANATP